jgi:DNA polymerase I
MNPSVMLGHNIFGYDIPYLIYCADQAGTSLALGRDESSIRVDNWVSKYRVDGSKTLDYMRAHVYGRNIIDTLFLSYKYDIGRNYDNYKLKYIVAKEGLEVENRVFYDGGQIRFKYTDVVEWKKIKEYCIHDSDDALALYDLMIPAFFYLTPSIPKTFQQMLYTASGSQINSFMVRSYLQNGMSVSKTTEAQNFEGATSFGTPGIYRNVFKVDTASLYPSVMLTYNIHDKYKDEKNHFIQMVSYFTKERLKNKKIAKETKDPYYSGLEQAQKIVINSCFGMMGAVGLNYNSPSNAALITRKGREVLQQAIEWAQKKNYIIPNGDTDSISFCTQDMRPFSKEEQSSLLKEINSLYPPTISWEHDGIFSRMVIIKVKNYILKTEDGKVKIKGSALRSPNREPALSEFINKVIEVLLE